MDPGSLTPDQLSAAIHDAWIDLDVVRQEGDTVIVPGVIERNIPKSRSLARFPIEVHIRGLLEAVEDDEGVGQIPVQQVEFRDGRLRLEGAIPGRVVVSSVAGTAELSLGETPIAVRRWLRWRSA